MKTKATTTFTIEDVREMAKPNTSDFALEVWLDNNRKYIEEAMVVAGWRAIDTLLTQDGMAEGYEHL